MLPDWPHDNNECCFIMYRLARWGPPRIYRPTEILNPNLPSGISMVSVVFIAQKSIEYIVVPPWTLKGQPLKRQLQILNLLIQFSSSNFLILNSPNSDQSNQNNRIHVRIRSIIIPENHTKHNILYGNK